MSKTSEGEALAAKTIATVIGIILVIVFAFWLYRNNPDIRSFEREQQRSQQL